MYGFQISQNWNKGINGFALSGVWHVLGYIFAIVFKLFWFQLFLSFEKCFDLCWLVPVQNKIKCFYIVHQVFVSSTIALNTLYYVCGASFSKCLLVWEAVFFRYKYILIINIYIFYYKSIKSNHEKPQLFEKEIHI